MQPDDLERLVGRELRGLPRPRAPRTLLPSVLRAVDQLAARPWYARPWVVWPVGWQVASVLTAMVIVATLSLVVPAVHDRVTAVVAPVAGAVTERIAAPIGTLQALAHVVETIWRALVEPVAFVAMVPLVALFGASVVFGAALGRLGFGGSLQS